MREPSVFALAGPESLGSRFRGNDDQEQTRFRDGHTMTRPLDRRDALKRLGAAGVGLSLPPWLGAFAPPVVRHARPPRRHRVSTMTADHNPSAMGPSVTREG